MSTNAVSLKLPVFWPAQPGTWFTQAEAQFHLRDITADATKFYYVVAALDQDTAGRLIDVLDSPPAHGKYAALKKRLLSTYGLSRNERGSRLLHMRPLGDRKPSQLMDEMLVLLAGHTPCLMFEAAFLELMPEEIRLQLARMDFSDPRQVAAEADILWRHRDQTTVAAVSLREDRTKVQSRTPYKVPQNQAHDNPRRDWCFYHQKFGSKATKCRDPCTYQGNDKAGRR